MLPALYPILDVDAAEARRLEPLDLLDIWLSAGVTLLQLRAKSLSSGAFLTLADDVVRRARARDARVIVNDRADIARLAGAAGVHVGQDDLDVADVRAVCGEAAIVGVSTHSTQQVGAALATAPGYLAIGPVFETTSKGRAADPVVGLAGVRAAATACRAASCPLVAIGGITLDAAAEVRAAGADVISVIGDLLAGDPAERVRAWLDAVDEPRI